MPGRFSLFKKPWDKVMCTFELQEYGANGGKGWNSITEPTGRPISKAEAREMFKPDRHYRVIARAVEGEHAGRFIGVVWDHYELAKGLVKKESVREKPAAAKSKEPEEYLEEYVEKVDKVLQPIPKLFEVFDEIRSRMIGPQAQESKEQVQEGGDYQIPPPEFDGKLPAFMHPFVVKTIASEIKGVIDYGATRIQEAFGAGMSPGRQSSTTPEEEEEEVIPSLASFKERRRVEGEGQPLTEEPEEEEEEVKLPSIKREEVPVEEVPPEVVPSLEEERVPCVQCGRTDVSLNPNGLCDDCLDKISKKEEETEGEGDLPSLKKTLKRGKKA